MSVHIYISTLKQSLESSENELNIKATYSYLNARHYNIYQDDQVNPSGDLRKIFNLNLGTLIGLHGYKRDGVDDIYKKTLIPVIQEIENLFNNNKPWEILKEINGFKNFIRKGDSIITKKNELPPHINISTSLIQQTILNKMPNNLKVYSNSGNLNSSVSDDNVEYFSRFLDGKWLELYVEYILKKINNSIKTDTGWEIRSPDWSQAKNPDGSYKIKFELDVVALYGHQFIGISCTIAGANEKTRWLCKSKGFEIIHRSKQIGGDEAKSILVSNLFTPDPKKRTKDDITPEDLQDELENDTGGNGNILVLGSYDLKPNILSKKIEEFIKK